MWERGTADLLWAPWQLESTQTAGESKDQRVVCRIRDKSEHILPDAEPGFRAKPVLRSCGRKRRLGRAEKDACVCVCLCVYGGQGEGSPANSEHR